MAGYESEITRFIRELKQRQPDLDRKQSEARSIWWDKSLDRDEQARFAQARVRQQAYVYLTKPKFPR